MEYTDNKFKNERVFEADASKFDQALDGCEAGPCSKDRSDAAGSKCEDVDDENPHF